MYRGLLRPILFSLPPGASHGLALAALWAVENVAAIRHAVRAALSVPEDDRIAVHALGLRFPSPVGLAGGFDKNARRPRALAALGFGHLEMGTVTARAQEPNPAPNLFRLPLDRALINRLGFPNDGAERLARRLARIRGGPGVAPAGVRSALGVPLAVSIGKSRGIPADDMKAVVADYIESLGRVVSVADFVVVNISSPNTVGLRSLQTREHARELLSVLRSSAPELPMLVKVAPDLADEELDALFAVVGETGMAGVVATNTSIARENLRTDGHSVRQIGAGGLSGPPLRARSVRIVAKARARLGRQAVVIGVGGVESAEHVVDLLRAGANLVQMYTGLIYEGPGAPARIARELLRRIDETGARDLADLVNR
jgi:dihydroorotate dehydrogenase